jgi:SAM-dependent methyltransferase
MLQKVSYDERQHAQYQRGRAFPRERLTRWIETFAAYAPNARSLAVLDLGSGTGRLTPALAKAFGGPVYGVEPSQKMRGISESSAGHSAVVYRDGSAECIPLRMRASISCSCICHCITWDWLSLPHTSYHQTPWKTLVFLSFSGCVRAVMHNRKLAITPSPR